MKKDILKGNNLNITDLIFGSFEEHDTELSNAIALNSEYKSAEKKLKGQLNKLDTKTRLEIDDTICLLETHSRDTAFNEGFKLAVRLLMSTAQ